jgi:aspartyl-tRNA(Asn)/glutamyl-tRNA(Gln) amidotransferase subunit C
MHKLSNEEFDRLANLAKLEFGKEEKKEILSDLDKIIGFCEKLNSIPTMDIEPLVYVNTETNIVREDMVSNMLPKNIALKNAPSKDSDFFRVPKVLKPKN